jgi:hypothetical protein
MSWLVLGWFLTFGLVPDQAEALGASYQALLPDQVATVAEIGLNATAWGLVNVYGSIENYQYKGPGLSFCPFRADYKIGASISAHGLTIGIDHECDHPVIWSWEEGEMNTFGYGETRIYIKIQGTASF